jgi:3-phenylpropionate/cinnamic acid dioxygenase small subunit
MAGNRFIRVGAALLALMACGCAALNPPRAAALSDADITGIRQACADVSIQYALYLDARDFEKLPSVFTEDGVWEVLGNRIQGSAAIRNYWQSRVARRAPTDATYHQIGNQHIDVIDRDHAVGVAWFTVYLFATQPGANKTLAPRVITKSSDEYRRTASGWRLQRRSIERMGDVAQ